jgi:hypothetical protein
MKLKIKIKFTKESRIKNQIKRMKTRFKKITNHNYGFNSEIENKLKFDKRAKN